MFASRFPMLARIRIATLAITAVAAPAVVLADDHHPFLDRFDSVNLIASTVPSNGDVNPYGIVVVPRSVGLLKRGNILISNFNNSANAQGTGTTIVQVSPKGELTLFAQIDPGTVTCPGGVGLTTALVVLKRGWVIVGSLPTSNGSFEPAATGCLLVLNSVGQVVETFFGGSINGPWDMTALDDEDEAWLFVTNVLNGGVTTAPPDVVVPQGTVVRIFLDVPEHGKGMPKMGTATVIGSGFAEEADSAALVIGPTGVGLADDGTLYVADTVHNRIAAIPHALTRNTSASTGSDVSVGGALNAPLGLTIAPNGHIITANGGNGNLVETTPTGVLVAVKTVTANGGGALFGIAVVPNGQGIYFVDDGDNTLKVFDKHGKDGKANE